MTIILYDLVSLAPEIAWSPYTRKARFCLNYNGIPYKTEWVDLSDIRSVYKKCGIQPTPKHLDGSLKCTLPVIYVPSTGAWISDSFTIAKYLDQTYPTGPTIFPHGSQELQAAFVDAYLGKIKSFGPLITLDLCHNSLTPAGVAVYKPRMDFLHQV